MLKISGSLKVQFNGMLSMKNISQTCRSHYLKWL